MYTAPFLGQVRLRPAVMGCGGGFIPAPLEQDRSEEESQMMGCAEHGGRYVIGCPSCKRRKRRDWTLEAQPSSEMVGSHRTERHGIMAGRILGQGAVCTAQPPVITPDMNCQRTESGDIICSNNVIYSGTCPNAPAVNYPGVAPHMPGTNIPKAPPYKTAEEIAAGITLPVQQAVPGAPQAGAPPSSTLPVVGIVAGGVVIAGLAYLLFSK